MYLNWKMSCASGYEHTIIAIYQTTYPTRKVFGKELFVSVCSTNLINRSLFNKRLNLKSIRIKCHRLVLTTKRMLQDIVWIVWRWFPAPKQCSAKLPQNLHKLTWRERAYGIGSTSNNQEAICSTGLLWIEDFCSKCPLSSWHRGQADLAQENLNANN